MRLMFSNRILGGMAGGVQRAITTVVNGMAERGHEVTLLTWDDRAAQAFFPISPGVVWCRLDSGDTDTKGNIRVWFQRAMAIRKVIREHRPEVIVGFRGAQFLVVRLYSLGLGVPAIAAERGSPQRFDHMRRGSCHRFVEFSGLRLARTIVIQSERYRSQYPEFLRNRISVIPNPVFPVDSSASPERPDHEGRYRVLSVGRLSYQKNYWSLISAFGALAKHFPSWDLVILGEGDQRPALERIVGREQLTGRVWLPGTRADVSEWYEGAHLFCLPSRHEGFPNALAEAQAHGLPAVGYQGCAGVNELIKDGKTGVLAQGNGEVGCLAEALATLMADPEKRKAMGVLARMAVEAYRPEAVMDAWERLLEGAIEGCET